ncbi:MAG: hypothetical protein ACKOEZ_14440 [Spartobacteria bacterium]
MTTSKKSGGRCGVSAEVSGPRIRLKGRGGSPSGPKIHNLKFIIQNPKSATLLGNYEAEKEIK